METRVSQIGYRVVVQVIEEQGSARREVFWRELASFPARDDSLVAYGRDRDVAVAVATEVHVSPEFTICDSGSGEPYRRRQAHSGGVIFLPPRESR
ncbi:MAG: hypothetical protein GY719_25845 [bacterium]|nr:hypothetical protein [bacterium]